MLIQALCDYADKQEGDALPEGWGHQEVDYRIMLTPEGEIADIVDVRIEERFTDKKGKEKITAKRRKLLLPFRAKSTSISCYCGEHRPFYIFGLQFENGAFSTESDKDKARKSHIAYVKHELAFFEGLDSEMCTAYRNFVEKWNPENETNNIHLLRLGKDYSKSYFCFGLTGARGNLEEDAQFAKRYREWCSDVKEKEKDTENNTSFCAILGEKLPIARIHENIKLPGGNTTGCALVSMKESAFTSYGKTQSFNSNISEAAMKKYTATLNRLLADKSHRTIIGDMVVTYFAMKADDSMECDLFSMLLGNPVDDSEASMNELFQFVKGGGYTDTAKCGVEENVTFYVVGMTPNSSRICQKFIHRDTFGRLIQNLIDHQNDMKINENNPHQIFFSTIAKQLISPKSTNEVVPPPLMTGIMLAAFQGTPYPQALLATTVRRVKTDSDEEKNHFIKLNDTRAGIIKACINRSLRSKGKEEEFTMSLNENNLHPAYLCGRLFAVLEMVQQDSSGGGLNRTIKDSYFASACARPSSVMPKLLKLAQNHMRKLNEAEYRNSIYYNKLIGEIINGFEGEYPQTLSLDDQGRFIIGYYQQNRAFYSSKKED